MISVEVYSIVYNFSVSGIAISSSHQANNINDCGVSNGKFQPFYNFRVKFNVLEFQIVGFVNLGRNSLRIKVANSNSILIKID